MQKLLFYLVVEVGVAGHYAVIQWVLHLEPVFQGLAFVERRDLCFEVDSRLFFVELFSEKLQEAFQ